MPTINDPEFGEIVVRKYKSASSIKIRRAPDGRLRISAPISTPNFIIKNFIKLSRGQIRRLIKESSPDTIYNDGMQIGKSHTLVVGEGKQLSTSLKHNMIHLSLPTRLDINDPEVIVVLRPAIIKALKKEAKGYLPRRLDFIARQHEFDYKGVKFSHASSRWGSCRSDGSITLNIALMKLPFELIDYVIAHELSHTRQMNHSLDFWNVVGSVDPNYKKHRKLLKNESPNI